MSQKSSTYKDGPICITQKVKYSVIIVNGSNSLDKEVCLSNILSMHQILSDKLGGVFLELQ